MNGTPYTSIWCVLACGRIILFSPDVRQNGAVEAPGLVLDFENNERAIFRAFLKLRRQPFCIALHMHGDHGLGALVHHIVKVRDGNEAFSSDFVPLARELLELLRGLTAAASRSNGVLAAAQECGATCNSFTVLQYLQHRAPAVTAQATAVLERWLDSDDTEGITNQDNEGYEGGLADAYDAMMAAC